jgi:Arc/MetJ-type ribon-helix-helix transcriptional regulator/ElaB/YqjD/DUF883 family membrane-anchored ribosome-binding protein
MMWKMSGFEEELNRFMEEVKNNVNRLLRTIEEASSEISEIEGKIGSEKSSEELWEVFKNLKALRHRVKEEATKTRVNLLHRLNDFKREIREASVNGPRELVEELKDRFDELKDFFEDSFDEAEDHLDSFLDRVEDVEDDIRNRIRELRREVKKTETFVTSLRIPEIKIPEIKIPDVGKMVEESLSKAWTGVPSMVVSSVRLPQADLNLIDALVDAGIFKSRNEGIAFFAHKGIEASQEWLNRIKEKLDEIRVLQEEAKKEMEKMLGEPSSKAEDKGEEKV